MSAMNLIPVAHPSSSASTPDCDLLTPPLEDSASSEASTPGEELERTLHAPLSIDIPRQFLKPSIGTPFLTTSRSPYEYPFPPTPSRLPLSTTSSSSSINSLHGPPSSAAVDKHIPNLLARLTSRSPTHRRAKSATSPVKIPPRLRKLSAGHVSGKTLPVRPDATTPQVRPPTPADNSSHGSKDLAGEFVLRRPPSDRSDRKPSWSMTPHQLGPALSSTPRTCVDVRHNVPTFVDLDDDDERRLGDPIIDVEIARLGGF